MKTDRHAERDEEREREKEMETEGQAQKERAKREKKREMERVLLQRSITTKHCTNGDEWRVSKGSFFGQS